MTEEQVREAYLRAALDQLQAAIKARDTDTVMFVVEKMRFDGYDREARTLLHLFSKIAVIARIEEMFDAAGVQVEIVFRSLGVGSSPEAA